jgi:hypothetical protein
VCVYVCGNVVVVTGSLSDQYFLAMSRSIYINIKRR